MGEVIFYILAAISLIAAFNVIIQKRTVHAALSLVVCLGGVSGIYFLLGAQFIGFIQLIIYAGAIMVLFLIVIMLLDPFSEAPLKNQYISWFILSLALGVGLFIVIYEAIDSYKHAGHVLAPTTKVLSSNTQNLATALFHQYLLPFEVISILILVAIMGAVVLAKKKVQ